MKNQCRSTVVQQRQLTVFKQWNDFCSFSFRGKLIGTIDMLKITVREAAIEGATVQYLIIQIYIWIYLLEAQKYLIGIVRSPPLLR